MITFIQVGAHDGVLNDPLRPHLIQGNFLGVLVEPLPGAFAQLKQTYQEHENLSFANCCVSNYDGYIRLHVPEEHTAPAIQQKASVKSDHLERHGHAGNVRAVDVSCHTIKSLIEKYDIGELDLLVVDAEGHDYIIVMDIFATKIRPLVVFLEIQHFTRSERQQFRARLDSEGYWYLETQKDCLALGRELLSPGMSSEK